MNTAKIGTNLLLDFSLKYLLMIQQPEASYFQHHEPEYFINNINQGILEREFVLLSYVTRQNIPYNIQGYQTQIDDVDLDDLSNNILKKLSIESQQGIQDVQQLWADPEDYQQRYSDFGCFKHSSVQLNSKRYINANWIHNPLEEGEIFQHILTQGPLETTQADFWDMIIENNIDGIVAISEDNDINNVNPLLFSYGIKSKVSQYWPNSYSSNQVQGQTIYKIPEDLINIKEMIKQPQSYLQLMFYTNEQQFRNILLNNCKTFFNNLSQNQNEDIVKQIQQNDLQQILQIIYKNQGKIIRIIQNNLDVFKQQIQNNQKIQKILDEELQGQLISEYKSALEKNPNKYKIERQNANKEQIDRLYFFSNLQVTKNPESEQSQTTTVSHYHLNTWKDHAEPEQSQLQAYIQLVKRLANQQQKYVLHCSAGIGRSGTILSSIFLYKYIKKYLQKFVEFQDKKNSQEQVEKPKLELSIFEMVRNLRMQRNGAIQTQIQYEFLHVVVNYMLNNIESVFDMQNINLME